MKSFSFESYNLENLLANPTLLITYWTILSELPVDKLGDFFWKVRPELVV